MADKPPLLGVMTSSPLPASEPGPLLPLPSPPDAGPPLWAPAAQYALAIGIVLFVALLGWHGYGRSSFAHRPLAIERGEVPLSVVDLNTAGAADLRLLPGVGEKLARDILADRETNGPFQSVEDLRRVSGIGPVTLNRARPYLRVEAPSAGVPPRVARGGRPTTGDRPVSTRKPTPAESIDLNSATEAQLRQLPDIGPTLAARILDARARRRFFSVEDLRQVKGIGPKRLDKLRPFVRVGP